MMPFAAMTVLALLLGCSNSDARAVFEHVYFLFIEPPLQGCRDCYVPMLITRAPIDEASLLCGNIENVAILTYERDSIWEIRSDSAPLNRDTVSLAGRKLSWNGSRYRYQEGSKQEALRLLKNPMGSIPISRPQLPLHPAISELVKKLIDDLSNQR